MDNRKKLVLALLGFAVLSAVVVTYSILSERIPMNPDNTVGTLPGNAMNGGYFCEFNDTVYFSHVEDSHSLYSMRPDESDYKRLGNMGVNQICAAGKFLYFFMDSDEYSSGKGLGYVANTYGIYRYRISNARITQLVRARPRMMQLCGSTLYYAGESEKEGNGLYSIRIDKKDLKKLADRVISPAGFDGRYLYHTGIGSDPSLYSLNTAVGGTEKKVINGNVSLPLPMGDFVYYVDNARDYHLCRYNRTTTSSEEVIAERIDTYNTDGFFIWYATSVGDGALKRANMDGTDIRIVAPGVYNNICLTSRYTYFAPFDKSGVTTMFHVPRDLSASVSRFAPPTDFK